MNDYDNLSRQDLIKLRGEVDRAIASVGEREKREALKAVEAAAREHGFSLSDLVSGPSAGRPKAQRGSKAPAEARFRNPEDHAQTWSGRGRRPRWYNEAEAAGRPIEDLRG